MKKLILISACLSACIAFGATRYVATNGNNIPPYTNWADAAANIHSAVNFAQDGDTVLVSNGVYNISSTIATTNLTITIQSLAGYNATIINAQKSCRAFYIRNNSELIGFTVSNAHLTTEEDEPGAGIAVANGKVKHCLITCCDAKYGAGLFLSENAEADNCIIINNSATHAGAGAIVSENGMIKNSAISYNEVTDLGHSTNLYYGGGGALIYYGGLIENCVISNNSSAKDAGGIYIVGSGDAQRCQIKNNFAAINGGGISCENGGLFQSCLITDNIASNGGGAFILTNGILQNCTVADNSATNGGGAFFSSGGDVKNSIIFYNNASAGDNYFVQDDASFFYSVTQPAVSNIYDDGGNATNLPQFVNRSIDNYRLLQSSFSVDSATNLPGIFQLIELDGNCRVSNIVDRGAYELFAYPLPDISITTLSDTLTYDFYSYGFAGTNNEYATGNFQISNSVNGVVSNFSRSGLSWNSPALPLAVGTNSITAFASSAGKYVASDSIQIIRLGVGSGAPFINITNGNSSVIYDETSIFIAGTNNIHTVGSLWMTNFNNGYSIYFYPTSDDWFSVEIPLTPGTNDIYLFGTNIFGQITNDNVIIVREPGTGIPFVNITSEISFVTFDVTSINIAGTNNEQVTGMWLTNNLAGTVGFAAAESWSTPLVPLAVGTNFIYVFGTNSLGQISNDFINITRGTPGTGAPFIDCTNADREVENNITEIILTGTNNLNVVGKMKIENPLTGEQKFFNATESWTAPSISLDEGLNDIKISGTNIYGDIDVDLVLITRKGQATGPPFVDITTTSQWLNYDFASVSVAGTNNSHVTGAMWISNSANHAVNYFSSELIWTSAPIALAVGTNTLFVFGQNAAEEQTSDFVVITRGIPGTGTPVIQITNADKFVTFDETSIQISGWANSNVVGFMLVSNLLNNSTANFAAQPAWQAPTLPLDVGTNIFIVYGTNLFSEQGSDTAVIIREGPGSGIPFLDITTTASFVKSDVELFSVSGTNNPNIAGYMWTSNSANAEVETFPVSNLWTTPQLPLVIGWNDIYVFGSNLVNQTTSDVVRITRGTPGEGTPIITISTTNSILNYDYSTFLIEGTINFNVMGGMCLSNAANGAIAHFDSTQFWAAAVPIDVGTNIITAYGTNFLNDIASDNVTIIRLEAGTGTPFIDITNENLIVRHDTSSYVVAGTNNANIVGYMWITNGSDGSLQFFPASESWTAPPVNLSRHLNNISVFGTNIYGELAFDNILIDRPVPSGVTNFVSSAGSHQWPFISWATAATNIEAAVEETVDGNMVLVADETNFITSPMHIDKNIILKSVSGSSDATLIVKTSNSDSPIHFSKGVVDGFTLIPAPGNSIVVSNGGCFYLDGNVIIKNCVFKNFSAAKDGGAVYCDNGTISNCIIKSCFAADAGGAAYLNGGARLLDSFITNNYAPRGGGVYISFTGSVSNCELVGNYSYYPIGGGSYEDKGGALYCDNGGVIEHSLIHDNISRNGSAVYMLSNGKVTHCDIYKNYSVYYSAVYCEYGGEIFHCKISENTALNGAGVCLSYGGSIRNALIVNNAAAADGGGVYAAGNALLECCTISSNIASDTGGGIYSDSSASIINSIIYHNIADVSNNYYSSNGQADFIHSCSTPLPSGVGNISDDPRLANPLMGFFKPAADSPCINTGSNSVWMISEKDFAGNPRILNEIVDMGGYEFTNEPIIWTSLLTVDFGDVVVDSFVTSSFVIGNAGDEALNGSVQQIDPPFFIDSGSPYSISSLSSAVVSIMFAPSEETNYVNEIFLSGGGASTVVLKGNGIPEPYLFIIYHLSLIIYYLKKRL